MLGASFIQRCSVIKKISIFEHLNWFNVQLIARSGDLVRFKKGEFISKKGAPPDFVYFLVSGRLISYTPDSDGTKDDVEFIHRGMFFGIISALTGEEHSQTFEAINDSTVFRVPVERFKEILTRVPALSLKFSKVLSQRIRSKVTKTNLVSRSTIISVYAPIAGSGGSTYSLNLTRSLLKATGDKVIWLNIRSLKVPAHTFVSDIDDVRPKWKRTPIDLSHVATEFDEVAPHIVKSTLGFDLLNMVFNPDDKTLVTRISDFVNCFIDEYRYIIVDLPSDMDDVVMKTLSQSDLVHLILLRKRDGLEIGRAILDKLEEHLKDAFNEERVRVIISGVNMHRSMSEEAVRNILDYNTHTFLPHILRKDLAVFMDTPEISFWGINAVSPYMKTLTSVSREISGVSVGLVLGGGAAFGLAHIGVIKVLEEENIPIDIIVGSSMGALIGGLWAIGYTANDLQRLAYEFRKRSNIFKLIDIVFPLSGLISGKAIMAWLRSKYGNKTFRDTKIPLKVIAYDLIHRKDIIFSDGLLVDAIRKSISIPGVFQPVIGEDQIIIDGGVMNPLPTNILVNSDVKQIIAVNVLQSSEDVIKGYEKTQKELKKALDVPFLADPWYFIDTRIKFWVSRTFFPNISDIIVRTLEASESVIADQSGKAATVLIHPDLEGLNWFELYNADILIKRGENAARKQIDKIRKIAGKKV